MSTRLTEDSLIVSGYIHRQETEIPAEIIELCLKWYHIALFFEFMEDSRVEIMDDDKQPTIIKYKPGYGYTSCYGSVIMPSMSNNAIYQYNIKFDKSYAIAIGICDAEFVDTATFFYNTLKNRRKYYCLCSWEGTVGSQEVTGWREYADGVGGNIGINEVKLTYDAANATVSYTINNKDYGVAFNTSRSHKISYRMAIHVDCKEDMILEIQ